MFLQNESFVLHFAVGDNLSRWVLISTRINGWTVNSFQVPISFCSVVHVRTIYALCVKRWRTNQPELIGIVQLHVTFNVFKYVNSSECSPVGPTSIVGRICSACSLRQNGTSRLNKICKVISIDVIRTSFPDACWLVRIFWISGNMA